MLFTNIRKRRYDKVIFIYKCRKGILEEAHYMFEKKVVCLD